MFHNTSVVRKIQFKLGPRTWFLILLFLFTVISYYLWDFIKNKTSSLNDYNLFSELIYRYNLDMIRDADFNEVKAEILISSYKFDDTLFPMELVDAELNKKGAVWSSDSFAFGKTVQVMHGLMASTLEKGGKLYKNKKIWEIVDHFIGEIQNRIPIPPTNNRFPWGDNWYEFSVTFPKFMVCATFMRYRLFKTHNLAIERFLAAYTSSYFNQDKNIKIPDNVVLSMGWHRTLTNIILMAAAYIGGRIIMKNFKRSDIVCRKIKNVMKMEIVTSDEGLFRCSTFITHKTLRGFGYVSSAWTDFILLSKFFSMEKSLTAIYKIFEKTEHPTISLHFGPWFNRGSAQGTRKAFMKYGKLGFYTLDHMRGVSVKMPDWIISFNGQHPKLCFYESDQINNKWGQYWFSARRFMYADDDRSIYQELVPYYPGVLSYNNIAIEIQATASTTTQTFEPDFASCILVHLGNVIGMRNVYKIKYSSYVFDVIEMTMVTEEGIHCFYRLTPNTSMHSNKPMMVSVNMGKRKMDVGGASIGVKFGFEKNNSFVYHGKNQIVEDIVHVPGSVQTKDVVQIRLIISGGKAYGECGFSNVHSSSNELMTTPSINGFETLSTKLEWDENHPTYLFLYNKSEKMLAISDDMGNTSKSMFSIPKLVLEKKVPSGKFRGVNTRMMANQYVSKLDGDMKYQIVFRNVELQE